MEQMKSLQYQTKATDVTEKGIVTVGVNGIGIEDAQHDISMPGSFVDTLANDIAKMRWFLNHDSRQLLGVPLAGEEKADNLIMTGKINLDKQIGRDTLADYKLFAEAGRTLEHSIGVKAIERDENDRRKVKRWQMLEYSTLTAWGANPNTYLVGIKSGTPDQLRDAVDFIRMAFKQHGYSDERLKNYDMELNLLLKSLAGGMVVTCPCCGTQFDYEAEPEHTYSQQVQDTAADMLSWITNDIVRDQMRRLTPEIRTEVVGILDSFKGSVADLKEKGITDLLTYVRCPHCYSRVYRHNTLLIPSDPVDKASKEPAKEQEEEEKDPKDKKPEEDSEKPKKPGDKEEKPKKPKDEEEKKSAGGASASFWDSLNANIK